MSTVLHLRRRSQLLGMPAFSKGDVKRLGFVTQIWIDPHSLRVAGWTIRRDEPSATMVAVKRSATKLLGTGTLLVEPAGLSDTLDTDDCVRLVPQPLATRGGVSLGKIKDFTVELASGAIASVQTSGTGLALLPPVLDTTFEIPRSDLEIDGGLFAVEGAEKRLAMLQRGLLEQVGIGKFEWSQDLSSSKPAELDTATLEAIAEATAAAEVEVQSQPSVSAASQTDATSPPPSTPTAEIGGTTTGAEQSELSKPPGDAEPIADVASPTQPLDRVVDFLTASVQPLLRKLPQSLQNTIGLSTEEESPPPRRR